MLINERMEKQARVFPYPATEEHCGVILPDGTIKTLRNTHPEPEKHFRMDLRRFKQPGSFLAVFHTHLRIAEDEPSWHDLKQLRNLRQRLPDVLGIVLNVPLGVLIEYDGDGPLFRKLINVQGSKPTNGKNLSVSYRPRAGKK